MSTEATAGTVPAAVGGRRPLRDRRTVIEAALAPVALAALVVYFAARSDTFLSWANLAALSGQAGPLLFASLGATFVVLMGSIDLSVGAVALFSGSVAAWLLANGHLGGFAVPAAVLVGFGVGALSGAVVAYGGVPSFVATLGAMSILTGFALKLLDGKPLPFISPSTSDLAIGQIVPNVQNAGLWALVAWGLFVVVGLRTRFGLYAYAIGGGEPVARLSGVPVRAYKVLAFALSGATAACAGVLGVAQLGSGGPTVGSTLLLDSLAAIVVAGTSLSGGRGGVHRTLLGVLLIAVLANGLNQVGADEYTQQVIKGGVIIGAVLLAVTRRPGEVVK
jgi:ribose/xylose/arabinose/galactoside ABC-type transport system permease subunit